jgi:hypothetical protein
MELDHLFPEPYANLSFLYTRNGALDRSASVSDALTQVADTPMMWINRALILERQQDESTIADHGLEQAADAYRAALQVAPIPAAKNGLAMTCRRQNLTDSTADTNKDRACVESNCLLSEYLDATGRLDVPSRVFGGVSNLECGAVQFGPQSQRLMELGQQQIAEGLNCLDAAGYRKGELDTECVRSVLLSLGSHVDSTATPTTMDATNLKQQLLFEPNRGDLWLALAKELVRLGGKDVSAQEAATCAVHKASSLLMSQASEPFLRSDKNLNIPARDASEALSLRYWLDSISDHQPQIDDDEVTAARHPLSTVDLQRALLLCPNNALAREAIKQV